MAVHPNAELIITFYQSFVDKNGAKMAECYHPDARFQDPVFPSLTAKEAGSMWRMFCESDELRVEFSGVHANDSTGRAHWEAHYPFRLTGRQVHNCIDATFEFRDGLIYRQTDSFPFWKWSRMALGVPGVLLGWSPIVRNKVQKAAREQLDAFIARSAG